jgi:hypothetical protein
MFNCSINPRQHVDGDVHECVHIFRCAAMLQRYLVDRVIPDRKNHFVALCHPSTNLKPGDHYFVPKLPRQPQSTKATLQQTASACISHTKTMPQPVMPSMSKKKQFTAASAKRKQRSCIHSEYTFQPDKISGRRFQHDWFTRYPWLVYSAAVNGGFCINCALFGGESIENIESLCRVLLSNSDCSRYDGYVCKVSDFFNSSPKRTLVLRSKIQELLPPQR